MLKHFDVLPEILGGFNKKKRVSVGYVQKPTLLTIENTPNYGTKADFVRQKIIWQCESRYNSVIGKSERGSDSGSYDCL